VQETGAQRRQSRIVRDPFSKTNRAGHVVLALRVIDFPAGLIGDEDPSVDGAKTARRELEEETGYACDSVELLARGPSSPGITSEIVSLYRALGVRRIGEGGGVGNEDITVHLVPRLLLRSFLREKNEQGVLTDLKVSLYFLT